jgi:hypothetical protein
VLVLNHNTTASKAYNEAYSNKDNYNNENDGWLNKLEKAYKFEEDENYNCHAFSEAISTGNNLNYKSAFSQQAGYLTAQTFNPTNGTYSDSYNNDTSSDQYKTRCLEKVLLLLKMTMVKFNIRLCLQAHQKTVLITI